MVVLREMDFILIFLSVLLCTKQAYSFNKISSLKRKFELIGLFPVNISGVIEPEVLIWSESFRYFIEMSNKQYGDMFYYRMYDLASTVNYDLLTNVTMDIILENTAKQYLQNDEMCYCVPRNFQLYNVLGIVGAAKSFNTEYISHLVRNEKIVLISYASTVVKLSDKALFPNVYRTIPSDSYQIKVIIDLLDKMNWTYVSFIFEDNTYGYSGQKMIALSKVCLAVNTFYRNDNTNIETIVSQIKGDKKSNVVILWGSITMVSEILKRATAQNIDDKVWILSDAAGKNPYFIELKRTASLTIFNVIPYAGESSAFESYFRNITYEQSLKVNSWLSKYFERQPNVSSGTSINEIYSRFDFSLVGFVRNAVKTYVNALISLLHEKCPRFVNFTDCYNRNGISYEEYLKTVQTNTFDGLDGQLFSYKKNGDVNSGSFEIYTVSNEFIRFASWSSSKRLTEINLLEYNKVSQIQSHCMCHAGQEPSKIKAGCCVSCIQCSKENYFKASKGNHLCEPCQQGEVNVADKTSCKTVVKSFIRIHEYPGIIILMTSTLGIVFTLVILYKFIKSKDTLLVKSSQFHLSLIQVFSHLMLFVFPLLFIGPDEIIKCKIRTHGISLFFVFVITISLTKITHIVKIFKITFRLSKSEILQEKTRELLIIVLIMTIDIGMIFVLKTVYPIQIQVVETIQFEEYFQCSTNKSDIAHVIYVMFLQLLCGIQSFRGRHLPARYNEIKYTSFAMFLSTLLIATAVPLASVGTYTMKQLIRACAVMLANAALLFTIYGYKLIILFFCKDDSSAIELQKKRLNKLNCVAIIPSRKKSAVVKRDKKSNFVNSSHTHDNPTFEMEQ